MYGAQRTGLYWLEAIITPYRQKKKSESRDAALTYCQGCWRIGISRARDFSPPSCAMIDEYSLCRRRLRCFYIGRHWPLAVSQYARFRSKKFRASKASSAFSTKVFDDIDHLRYFDIDYYFTPPRAYID